MNFPLITSFVLSSLYLYLVLVLILLLISKVMLVFNIDFLPIRVWLDRLTFKSNAFSEVSPSPNYSNNKISYRHVLSFAMLSRLLLYVYCYLFSIISKSNGRTFEDISRLVFLRWDARHYINIAEKGYTSVGDDRLLIVFYPFYSLLIKFIGSILGGAYLLAAILISLTAFCLACVILYKLLCELYDSTVAMRSVIFMGLFPSSFFFGAAYTESLFVLLTLMCFSHARKREFIQAGIYGALAAFTRNFGILLIIPIMVELFSNRFSRDELQKGIVGFMLPITGFLGYLAINLAVTGNMFMFLKYQKENWHQQFHFFYKTFENIASYAYKYDFPNSISLWTSQLVIIAFTLVILVWGIRTLPLSLGLYSVAYMFLVISPSWLLSAPRYILPLFPLYIIMANKIRGRMAFYSVAVILAIIQLIYFSMFIKGWQVL